jgi:hypothetical protein
VSKKKVSKPEMETIILMNEAESDAEIYTYNLKLINRLKKYPSVATLVKTDDTGAHTFILPKKQLIISIRNPWSEEQKEKQRNVIRRKSQEMKQRF